MLLRIVEQALAGPQVPFPPWCDNPDVWPQGVGTQLKPNLVVSLASGSVADGVGTRLISDFDQSLGDERSSNGGTQQVLPLVEGVGPEHRIHEVLDELLPKVFDVDLLHAHGLGLGPGRLEFLALAKVGRKGHDLAVVLLFKPPKDDRGVQATRIGQHHLVDARLVRTHVRCLVSVSCFDL